jgi:hypothetical protein
MTGDEANQASAQAREEVNKVLRKAHAFINAPALRGNGKDLEEARRDLTFTVSNDDNIQTRITRTYQFSPANGNTLGASLGASTTDTKTGPYI